MSLVIYSTQARIATITLNRPEKRNAFNVELIQELMAAFEKAERDDTVKAVILKAEGEAFCAGADLAYLKQLQTFSYEENLTDSNRLKELLAKIYRFKKVVVAQVQGHALAGGCGLATVCDFVFAVPEARFGYTEVKIGFIPALVSIFLIRKLGEQKARNLLLSGELITAEKALELGLITRIVDAAQLEVAVQKFTRQLIESNSAQSLALTKELMAHVQDLPLAEALDHAAIMNAKARGTEDCKRGISAFLAKQELKW